MEDKSINYLRVEPAKPSLSWSVQPKREPERNNCKIVLCRWCHTTLTPGLRRFCSSDCSQSWRNREGMERGRIITIYTNYYMLGLLIGNQTRPVDFSHLIFTDQELVLVADVEEDALANIGDSEMVTYGAWWREIKKPAVNEEVYGYDGHDMRRAGLLRYLNDKGVTTERDVATAIAVMAREEALTPIELFDTL